VSINPEGSSIIMSFSERVSLLRDLAKLLLFWRRLAEGRNCEWSVEAEQSFGLCRDGLKLWVTGLRNSRHSNGGASLKFCETALRLLSISEHMHRKRLRKSFPLVRSRPAVGGICQKLQALFHVEHSTCSLGHWTTLAQFCGILNSLAAVYFRMKKMGGLDE